MTSLTSATDALQEALPTTTAPLSVEPSISFFSSSLQHLKTASTNASAGFLPSPHDIIMVVPRLVGRVGSFMFVTVPEHVDGLMGMGYGARLREIAEATNDSVMAATAPITASFAQGEGLGAGGATAATAAGGTQAASTGSGATFQAAKGFGSVFTYMTGHWAVVCFTTAIILNRAQIWASTRRHLVLNWFQRLLLRIIPIVVFAMQAKWFLQAMRCQTSPDYSLLRYGDPQKRLSIDYSLNGGMLYRISSFMLPWQNDKDSCLAANMIPSGAGDGGIWDLTGSFALLTPLFYSLCVSQLIETISCAVQGRQVQAETGMSIFEHSLAFAEAEAMVGGNLDWPSFGLGSNGGAAEAVTAATALKRSGILLRLNTPPEVLLIGLISSLSHLSSHVLGVLNLQDKLRLINTGAWGLAFMGAFVWSFLTFSPENGGDTGPLGFPTICIVGFIPHILILLGIFVCMGIYLIALGLSALSLPADAYQQQPPRSLRERLRMAQGNLQANVQLSSLRINMREDFYSALMKIGFTALTAASEAVYLNEGRAVGIRRWTWLEEERMKEIERQRMAETHHSQSAWMNPSLGLGEDRGEENEVNGGQRWRSGYDKERKTQGLIEGRKRMLPIVATDGVGAAERTNRWFSVWQFFKGILLLLISWTATGVLKAMSKVGINWRPRWLMTLVREKRQEPVSTQNVRRNSETFLEFWVLSDGAVLDLPKDDNIDVEAEMRKRAGGLGNAWNQEQEQDFDKTMYKWWLYNGWFGSRDASGDYQPADRDDDTTSVISMSTTAGDSEWDDEENDDGRTTPTQENFSTVRSRGSRASTPSVVDDRLDLTHLAKLLSPKNPAEREESTYLAHHLSQPDRILTRSQYRRKVEQDRARVLTSTRHRPATFLPSPSVSGSKDGPLSPEEEAELLEHILLARRAEASSSHGKNSDSSWADGGGGLGAGGPQCVICQSSPRTILVWPCRCLALCEECRVSLAMKNFGNCVCCRRDVVGFSRIFVP